MTHGAWLVAGDVEPCDYPIMGPLVAGDQHPAVRIGDAERDGCLAELVEHHARGRLTVAELDQRQTAALAAVTAGDLSSLLADLPGHGRTVRATSAGGGVAMARVPRDALSTVVKWASVPFTFATTGVVVASVDIISDERQFAAGVLAAGVGYLTHLVMAKRPRGRESDSE